LPATPDSLPVQWDTTASVPEVYTMDVVLQDVVVTMDVVSVAIVDAILYKAKQFLLAAFCKVEDAKIFVNRNIFLAFQSGTPLKTLSNNSKNQRIL
jgi:hypothetical protein